MPAPCWRRPSGCARTSAPMRAGWPARCACSPTPTRSPNFCPRRLSSFLAAHPHVSVDLEERLSDEIVGLIAEGVADIGDRGRHGRCRAGWRPIPFRSDRFVLVVARDHPLARRAKIDLPKCSITISSGSIARARCSAFSPTRRPRRPADPAAHPVALVRRRCAGWSSAMSASASCRKRPRAGPPRPWRSRRSNSPTRGRCAISPICVRDYKALPPYARQLVDHMREERREIT